MKLHCVYLASVALALLSTVARAEAEVGTPPVGEAVLAANDQSSSAVRRSDKGIFLTLNECIEIAIQNNLGLKISRLHDRASDIAAQSAWGQYYPTFNFSTNHANSRAVGQDTGNGTNSFSSGITQLSPWGTQLNFAVTESRTGLDRSAATGSAGVNVSQRLWKGAGADVGLNTIRATRIQRLVSRGSLERDTQQLIFQVRQAYAEIIQQIQSLEVIHQSVKSAKAFLDLTAARKQSGFVTILDVSNADVQLRRRELAMISGERALETAYDTLKRLMDVDLEEMLRVDAALVDFGEKSEPGITKELRSDESTGTVILVAKKDEKNISDPTILFQAVRFDENIILQDALNNRIDLLNSRHAVAIQELNTLLAKNGLGHEINLVGGFSRSHTGRGVVERDNGRDVNSWNVGLNYSLPLGKISDRAAYETALLSLREAEINLKTVRVTVQLDVRNILRLLRECEKTILIEARCVEQAKRAVDATKSRFAVGQNSSYDVIQSEDNLLSAKNDFIFHRLQYGGQLAQLEVVVGKPTGRVDLSGQSVGGTIDSHLPPDMRELPASQPEQ
ncbi:MAG: TolC family protein [Planctomycetota bacterium]